jgi:hypothetical protein
MRGGRGMMRMILCSGYLLVEGVGRWWRGGRVGGRKEKFAMFGWGWVGFV